MPLGGKGGAAGATLHTCMPLARLGQGAARLHLGRLSPPLLYTIRSTTCPTRCNCAPSQHTHAMAAFYFLAHATGGFAGRRGPSASSLTTGRTIGGIFAHFAHDCRNALLCRRAPLRRVGETTISRQRLYNRYPSTPARRATGGHCWDACRLGVSLSCFRTAMLTCIAHLLKHCHGHSREGCHWQNSL